MLHTCYPVNRSKLAPDSSCSRHFLCLNGWIRSSRSPHSTFYSLDSSYLRMGIWKNEGLHVCIEYRDRLFECYILECRLESYPVAGNSQPASDFLPRVVQLVSINAGVARLPIKSWSDDRPPSTVNMSHFPLKKTHEITPRSFQGSHTEHPGYCAQSTILFVGHSLSPEVISPTPKPNPTLIYENREIPGIAPKV